MVNATQGSAEVRELDEYGFVILPDFFHDLLVSLRVH